MLRAGWSNIWPVALAASASNQEREVWHHPRDPGSQPLQSGWAGHKEGDRPDINPRTLLLPFHCIVPFYCTSGSLALNLSASTVGAMKYRSAQRHSVITAALNRYKFINSTEGNSTRTTHTSSKKNVKMYEGSNVLCKYMKAAIPLTIYECCNVPQANNASNKQTDATTRRNTYRNLPLFTRCPCLAVHCTEKSDDTNWPDKAMRGSTGEG